MTTGVAFEIPEAIDLDDVAPVITGENDIAPLRCQQSGCTEPVTKPARGRTPKYCEDHKRGSGTPRPNNKSSLSGKSWPKATEIETLLNKYVVGLSFGITFVNPVDGTIILEKAPDVVHELVELAKDDIQLRKYLEWLAAPGKYTPLTMACTALIFPILENHGVIGNLVSALFAGRSRE